MKTNPIGLELLERRFSPFTNVKKAIIENSFNRKKDRAKLNNQNAKKFYDDNQKNTMVRTGVFDYHKNQKVLRLTKNVVRNCRLINFKLIKENINVSDFKFESLVILLENDSEGFIRIDRVGSDFDFLYLKNLKNFTDAYFDTYSFLTREFSFGIGGKNSEFIVQILAYLYFGEVTTKYISSKGKVKISSYTTFLNNSKFPITYVDSLWKQRICVNGFKVRGHFRMQPFGENRKKKKLIWIEEFSKDGYNRKATRELTHK